MQPMTRLAWFVCLLALIAGCATGQSTFNKAEELHKEGRLDDAVLKYAEASNSDPENGEYRMRFLSVSEQAAAQHLKKGDEFLAEKRYEEAYREYQTAVALNPALDKARQQSEHVGKLRNAVLFFQEGERFEKDRKLREALRSFRKALEYNPDYTAAKEAAERLLKSRKTKLDGYELNLKSTKPITLKFKDAKIKEVFNILSQLSGINFIFDEGLKDQNVTIYLENATFQQALEIITGIYKLGKKVLNENTIIVFAKTAEKTKQYEELFVRTFYLNKLDAKKAVNLIRTMLQVKKIYVNEEMNALVIRDTPDVLDVAGRIIEANDVPDAEVVLEVEVIELGRKNVETFGLTLSRYAIAYGTVGPQGKFLNDFLVTTGTVAAGGTTSGGTNVATTITQSDTSQLLNLFKWGDYSGFVTVPNAVFQFGKGISRAETLSNPRLRVKNREKAKFNVGTRVPITTTSSNGAVGGVNVNVQYVDVGVKVNAEPIIQLNNEVSMKVSLEVSSILSKETVGSDANTTVVTIGTRNLDTVLSLKDGETSIIGGLMQNTKTKSSQRVALLGDIPLIGPLFSGNQDQNEKSELVLAITPHIVRSVTIPDTEVISFWTGMEDDPALAKASSAFTQEPELINPPSAEPAVAPASAKPAAAVKPSGASPPAPQQPSPSAGSNIPAPQAPPPNSPQPTLPAAPHPETVSGQPTEASATPQPVPAQPITAPAPVEAPSPPVTPEALAAAVPQPSRISLAIIGPDVVKVTEQFTVALQVTDAVNLYGTPFTLVYDPNFLEFVGASEGDLLRKDGKPTIFKATDDKVAGKVVVGLTRIGSVGGVNGSGILAQATFKAKNKGPASIGFTGVNFLGPAAKQLEVIPYNAVVDVQ